MPDKPDDRRVKFYFIALESYKTKRFNKFKFKEKVHKKDSKLCGLNSTFYKTLDDLVDLGVLKRPGTNDYQIINPELTENELRERLVKRRNNAYNSNKSSYINRKNDIHRNNNNRNESL